LVVLACATALAASATAPKRVPVPVIERAESVEEEAPVEGLRIRGVPYGATGWKVQVLNDTDQPISIVWDESSFVASNGVSAGRIVSGNTRRIDIGRSQPPAPLAPGAATTEILFAEKLYEVEAVELKTAEHAAEHGGISPDLARIRQRTRAETASTIIGGKLYLAIQTANGKQTWRGVIRGERVAAIALPMAAPTNPRNDPAKARVYFCSSVQCFADEVNCPGCGTLTNVWCTAGEPGFLCASTREQCLNLLDSQRDRSYGECVTQRARGAR
jgi:hypothetical protein